MKRKVEKQYLLSNDRESATIVIDKDGMRVENKSEEHTSDDTFIEELLTSCINLDQWNHSWHIAVGKAKYKHCKERKQIRRILNEKIEKRKEEIKMLKDARQVLGRWSYKF